MYQPLSFRKNFVWAFVGNAVSAFCMWLLLLVVAKAGLIDWWACYPSEELGLGNKQFRYVYCSFLLVKKTGYSLFYARY